MQPQHQRIELSLDVAVVSRIVQRAIEQAASSKLVTGELMSTPAVPPIGEPWPGEGGYNGGLFQGGDRPYYLIVPHGPEAEFSAAYGGYEHETAGADSAWDGLGNTRALLADTNEHPAAKICAEFSRDGHGDFYLPARRELQVLEVNVPHLFAKGYHWSSTQYSAYTACLMDFEYGWQTSCDKSDERLARPVRRKFL